MYCARHPKIETNLRCGKCDTLICPKCSVPTPVGARCPDCARMTRLPVFRVSALHYLKAAVVSLGLAAVAGILWGLADPYLHGLSAFVVVAIGYGIWELGSRSINRKRGTGLQIIFGAAVVISFIIAVAFGVGINLYTIAALIAGVIISTSRGH